MNTTKIKIILCIVVITVISVQSCALESMRRENARLENNNKVLLEKTKQIREENKGYKVLDSLNAIKVLQLELTLNEYKQYREKDAEIIRDLKLQKSSLERLVKAQSENISDMELMLSDSIRVDTVTQKADTLRCFSYASKWTDVNGCVADSIVSIQISNRESLLFVESVEHKRFLGFLWRTKKVKNRNVDVVSENPNTTIVNCEYISFKQ